MHIQPALLARLEAHLPATLQILKDMVAINSHTLNKSGVRQLAELTSKAFARLGFAAEYVPSVNPDFGEHLILTRTGTGMAHIGFVSHLDTVFTAEEERRNNFTWRIAGDRIYGPGTEDIKGGTAMMWLVLQTLREAHPDVFNQTRWTLLLDSSEEMLSADFGALCVERLKKAQAALVFEAGWREQNQFNLVAARKGRAAIRVEVSGRGAHAGNTHTRGANAIRQLANTVERIEALTDHSIGLTFNVGLIHGGATLNRVPHHAIAEVEMRSFSVDAYQTGLRKLKALESETTVRSVADSFPCRVSIRVTHETPPWPKNEGSEHLIDTFREAAAELGCEIVREERAGLSDGNFLWQTVPTLDGLGPKGDNAHCSEVSADGSKDQEYVEPGSFVPKAALNIQALLRLLRSHP